MLSTEFFQALNIKWDSLQLVERDKNWEYEKGADAKEWC